MKMKHFLISKAGDQEGDDPTFLMPGDIQPTWKLMPMRYPSCANGWEVFRVGGVPDFMAPALARGLGPQFAQEKRRKKVSGDERPWVF
jgi:hypothetical protein